MSVGLGMVLKLEHRLEHRLELPAPSPPTAVTGMEGLRVADEVLKELSAVGILIGGIAKELWRGADDEGILASHKDVDVLVLSTDCEKHPAQWQAGVDWWIYHNTFCEKPTNGALEGIFWQVELDSSARRISPGLYLCPREVLVMATAWERLCLGEKQVRAPRFTSKSPNPILPELDFFQVVFNMTWATTEGSSICKPYRG